MSDRELKAKISGEISPTVPAMFKTLTDGSAKAGTAIEQMGKKSGKALKDMAKSSEDSRARMAALGAAATSLAGFLSDAGRASEESAQIQRGLEQAVENTGHAYEEYADRIDAASDRAIKLGIDDEKLAQAIQALTGATKDAGVALDYIGLVQDIAADKGRDLASVSETVGKALNGNIGALSRLGYAVDENATAQENLAAIQKTVHGQAEASANTIDKLTVKFDNWTEAAGENLAGMAPYIGLLPGLSAGYTALGAAIGAIAPNATKAGAASKALSLALSPGGITIAAGAAAFGIYKLIDALTTSYGEAAREVQVSSDSIALSLSKIAGSGDPEGIIFQSWVDQFDAVGVALDDLGAQITEKQDAIRRLETEGSAPGADTAAIQVRIDAYNLEIAALKALKDSFGDGIGAQQDYAAAGIALNAVMNNAGPSHQALVEITSGYFNLLQTGQISVKEFIDLLTNLGSGITGYDLLVTAATKSTGGLGGAVEQSANAVAFLSDAMGDAGTQTRMTAQQQEILADVTNILTNGNERQIAGLKDLYDQYETNGFSLDSFEHKLGKTADAVDKVVAAEEQQIAVTAALAEGHRQLNNAMYGRPADAFDYEGDAAKILEYSGALVTVETNLDRMARGSTSAAVAVSAFGQAFALAQDNIVAGQGPFNEQLSAYNTQLGYLEAAEDLLNQRREEGIALTAEQAAFLRDVDAAQSGLTSGTEEATIALGMQALQYAENVRVGEEMNSKLGESTAATGDLVSIIRDLILSMDDIPEEIRTRLELDDNATAKIGGILGELARLDGYTVNTYVNTIQSFGGGGGGNQFRNGGVVEPRWPTIHARDGLITPGGTRMIRMNEAGGEDVIVPGGSFVRPAAASAESRGRSRGRGGENIVVNTLILHPASPDIYKEIRSRALSGR